MEILAIIPARGGSKGIPGKNIKDLNGKPLIAWTIDAAKKSKHITRTIVSTDDEAIAAIAREYGAEVPFLRPTEISGDLATDVEFLTHALNHLKETEGYEPDVVLRLPPTSPLRTAAHIDEGIDVLLNDETLDAVRPIVEAPKHPYKFWKIAEDGTTLEPFLSREFTGFDEPQNLPRQLFPKVQMHTGAMDIMRLATVRELKSTSVKRLGVFYMAPEDSINIDAPIDFEMADMYLRNRGGTERGI